MILRRLRSFVALDGDERRLAMRAIGWLALMRVALPVLSFASIRRWIESVSARGPATTPAAVRRAVQRAARTLPGSACLAQSLAAEALLRSGGSPARLTIGVAGGVEGTGPALDAHAWVESGDILVAGDGQLDRYQKLLTYGSSA